MRNTSFINPAKLLAGNIGKMADGAPTQPAIPSHRSYRPKATESETTGVQCPGSMPSEKSWDLAH